MEMLQMQSVEIKELERLQSLLSNKLYHLTEALAQKSDVDQISKMIDEVSESTNLYVSLQRECIETQESLFRKYPSIDSEKCASHLAGIKHYFHVENFNRLTYRTVAFYSDILSQQVAFVEKSLESVRKK